VRNVLAEYAVAWNGHDTAAFGRLFTEDCDYVNIAGVHWKGVQEIVQRHMELFQKRLKTAVRKLTGAEVRFSTPDVALVHATWDVTGSSRPTGEAVRVLKEITTMVMVKTNGKWQITSFQNTESGARQSKEQNLVIPRLRSYWQCDRNARAQGRVQRVLGSGLPTCACRSRSILRLRKPESALQEERSC
jgi:uncharacterized protein (TIGR02246 family)